MKPKIFIDGDSGTTGLKIRQRLMNRMDLEILEIDREKRKDADAKRKIYRQADLVILCLPDDAAKEAVRLCDNPKTKIIDCSTAHRCASGWIYGLPEIFSACGVAEKLRERIQAARLVANPGCYPTAFGAMVNPLSNLEIIDYQTPIFCWAKTGYSGGGKKMIEEFESAGPEEAAEICCRTKNHNLNHRHLPEMKKHSFLEQEPLFFPTVANFFQGMQVNVLISNPHLAFCTPEEIRTALAGFYATEKFIKVAGAAETEIIGDGFLPPYALNNTNFLEIFVFGTSGRINLVARLDNLGKGSSGAAVQNMNLMLGLPETTGLL